MRGIGWTAKAWVALGLATLCLLVAPARAGEPLEGATVEQIIGILHEKGLIDDEQQERLLVKNAAEQQKQAQNSPVSAKLMDGWDFYGDFRLRHEVFAFSTDTNGNSADNRYRFRYRVRLGFEKTLTDSLLFGMRLSTGGTPSSSEDRSTNQTLGGQEDFDYDSIRIDRAYVKWALPDAGALRTTLVGGKMANPLVWKYGKDAIIWDHDVQPEGGAALFSYPIDEDTEIFSNVAYFIDDEISERADPKLWAVQLGGLHKMGDVEMGLRGTMYYWRSLDSSFIDRTSEFGNLPTAFSNGKARVGDLSAFVGTSLSENWPALLYARYARNFLADDGYCTVFEDTATGVLAPIDCSGPAFVVPGGSTLLGASSVGDEQDAWGIGVEVGSSERIGKLGFGYFHVEANSVISLFTDSDVLDGFTNRRGWVVYGGRRLTTATEFRFAYYNANYVENDAALFLSTRLSDRQRLQTDVIFKF